jgi:hypothetical protein
MNTLNTYIPRYLKTVWGVWQKNHILSIYCNNQFQKKDCAFWLDQNYMIQNNLQRSYNLSKFRLDMWQRNETEKDLYRET